MDHTSDLHEYLPNTPPKSGDEADHDHEVNLNDKDAILRIIDNIYELVPQSIDKLGDAGEAELGKWVNIASYVSDNIAVEESTSGIIKLGDIAKRARTAVQCIIAKPSGDHQCAMEMRHEILIDIYRVEDKMANWLIEITNGSPAVTVVFGVVTAMTIFLGLLLSTVTSVLALDWLELPVTQYALETFGKLAYLFPWAIIAAFIGGTASVLMRLDSFEARRGVDPKLLFLNAVFKPYIGMIISFFVVAVQGLGIISVPGLDPQVSDLNTPLSPMTTSFLLAVGFLSGFSERFAKDFIGTTEDAFSGGRSDKRRSGGGGGGGGG